MCMYEQRMQIFRPCLLKAAILDNEVSSVCIGKCESTPGMQGIALYYYYDYYRYYD